jgi:hypothetical protein
MVSKNARLLTVAAIAGLIALSGCGRTSPQMARPLSATSKSGAVAAKGVAPDQVFASDLRRAKYWAGDAVHVMAVHTTFGNSTKLGASANVFFSEEARIAGATSVFVARHYGVSAVAQYTEMKDYAGLAGSLQPIENFVGAARAEEAWSKVKQYNPAPAPSPSAAPAQTYVPNGQTLLSTMAFLVQGTEGADSAWSFYTSKQKFTINALTGALGAPQPRVDPNDRLNTSFEANLQRAAAVWLPNKGTTNRQDEPQGTN